MPRKLALKALPGFQDDINALPDIPTRKMALDMLVLVRDGRVRGEKLNERVDTGDLGDCYKFYFDPDGSGKPRFRLVYRFTPDEVSAVAIEAVAVGQRANMDSYRRAIKNLKRTSGR
jgi:mRNA interferase RelE/StbE